MRPDHQIIVLCRIMCYKKKIVGDIVYIILHNDIYLAVFIAGSI